MKHVERSPEMKVLLIGADARLKCRGVVRMVPRQVAMDAVKQGLFLNIGQYRRLPAMH